MTEQEVLDILVRVGAITHGHFDLSSRKHSPTYVDKTRAFEDPEAMAAICAEMASRFAHEPIDGVIGPVSGGKLLAEGIAREWKILNGTTIEVFYAEKVIKPADYTGPIEFYIPEDQILRLKGKYLLGAEDVTSTGGSIGKVMRLVQQYGGISAGIVVLCNRGNVTAAQIGDFGPLESLCHLPTEMWTKEECPQCKAGVEINTNLGRGKLLIS